MKLSVTLQQMKDFLKKDDPKDLEKIDRIFGLTMIMLPIVFEQSALSLLTLLTTKNELIKITKGVVDALRKKKDNDNIKEYERMKIAYGLIVYTSFLESLSKSIPDRVITYVNQYDQKQNYIDILRPEGDIGKVYKSDVTDENDKFQTWPIPFPHPMESLADQKNTIKELYDQMGAGFYDFLVTNVLRNEPEKDLQKIKVAVAAVTQTALVLFEHKFFDLCTKYEKFAIWANIQSHGQSEKILRNLSQELKDYIEISEKYRQSTDIGFGNLQKVLKSVPETLRTVQAEEIVSSLSRHYKARINEPIIDASIDDDGKVSLTFPLVKDAFIPQSYRYLMYATKNKRLEDEALWNKQERREDLGLFIINYLSSPYSLESPLIILGHPGSGKSLLTTMIAANFMSDQYTTIKVPLREVNSEIGIVAQIEEQIAQITNIKIDSWAKVSSSFSNAPLIVILDGYDELLQASGKVFTGYLRDVQNFQKNEYEQGRPVRVIVTSRITLIDKATIPLGATVVRLLEFNRAQTMKWISIWNGHNRNFFLENDIQKFALPSKDAANSPSVLSLAEQPLLLLMLAIYDSENNKLRRSIGLERTVLYDSLIRRFIYREKSKDKRFRDFEELEMQAEIDVEMQRLSIAAIGMYNRRKLHILAQELNDDISFFELEKNVKVQSGRPMTQADLLLGSFFFIHKSKSRLATVSSESLEEVSAFEFLHNTFGEFLAADFIIQQAIKEADILKVFRSNPKLLGQREKQLGDADGLTREWFASYIYTPLFSRPVILEMIGEWKNYALNSTKITESEFMTEFDIISSTQIQRLLNQREMPSLMRKEAIKDGYGAPFGDHPLLGHIAIYSINLITLRAILDTKPFVFVDSKYSTRESYQPWNQLINIWRAWFGLEGLQGFTAILSAKRGRDETTITVNKTFQVSHNPNRLETFHNVNLALGDDISALVSGIALFESNTGNDSVVDTIFSIVKKEDLERHFSLFIEKASNFSNEFIAPRSPLHFLRSSQLPLFDRAPTSTIKRYQYATLLSIFKRAVTKIKRDPNRANYLLRDIMGVLDLLMQSRGGFSDYNKARKQFLTDYLVMVNDFLYTLIDSYGNDFYYHPELEEIAYRLSERGLDDWNHPAILEFLLLTHNERTDKYLFEVFRRARRARARNYFFHILRQRPAVITRLIMRSEMRGSDWVLQFIFEILDPGKGDEDNHNLRSLTFGVHRVLSAIAERSVHLGVREVMERIDSYLAKKI